MEPNGCITGVMTWSLPSYPQPFEYTAPPPKAREWVNRDDVVWCLTVEYRKPSLGDAGVLGTYRTHEKAKAALAEEISKRYDRELTPEELADGAVYTEDEAFEIVEKTLE